MGSFSAGAGGASVKRPPTRRSSCLSSLGSDLLVAQFRAMRLVRVMSLMSSWNRSLCTCQVVRGWTSFPSSSRGAPGSEALCSGVSAVTTRRNLLSLATALLRRCHEEQYIHNLVMTELPASTLKKLVVDDSEK